RQLRVLHSFPTRRSSDLAWRFTYVNPEAEALFGRVRKELLGGELWQKFPELRGTTFEQNYRQVMAEQAPIEFEACDPSGTRWFEDRKSTRLNSSHVAISY